MAGVENLTEELRQLRVRAGFSMEKMAQKMGYKSASGYQRYEDAALYTKKYLSVEFTEKLLAVLVGHGTPPITADDVRRFSGQPLGSDRLSSQNGFDAEMMAKVIESVLALLSQMGLLDLDPPASDVADVLLLTYEEATEQERAEQKPDLTEIASNVIRFEARRRVFRPVSSPGENFSGETIKT